MSPELETRDQLLTGDMQLMIIRRLFSDDEAFRKALIRMIEARDIELLDEDGRPMPMWRCRDIMDTFDVSSILHRCVRLTVAGAQKIA